MIKLQKISALRLLSVCLLMVIAIGFSACSSSKEKRAEAAAQERIEGSVESLYNEAANALDEGDYRQATQLFEEVERQYPYSQWATQAQLMSAFSYYKARLYQEAVIGLDRFIELHPGSDDVDYAHYLKALSFYEQISDVARDQQITQEALNALETLIRRFPDSKYARDASLKRDLTYDHLAGKEMEIGRYYLKGNHINAAINRFRVVIEKYQTTTHTAEALHRLVEAYLTLGLTQEATQVAAVLGHNYPGSKWYERSFALLDDASRQKILDNRGFINRTVDSLFAPG